MSVLLQSPVRSEDLNRRSQGEPPRRATRVEALQAQVERLLARMRIAVIYGGNKADDGAVIYRGDNPRPWKSYQSVAEDIAASLSRLGCREVRVMPDDMRLGQHLVEENIHFAWLNTGGVQGLCAVSHTPAIVEMLGVPYVGHDPLTAGILDTKNVFKQLIRGAGIPTAPFITWHAAQGPFCPDRHERFAAEFAGWNKPFVVKPVSGRASLHVEVVDDWADLADVVHAVYEATQNFVMIEGYLAGREYCVAACGPVISVEGQLQRLDEPFAFAEVERVLGADERIFTSMDKKPITGERVRALDPTADAAEIAALRALARDVFQAMSLETLVRLDVRADDEGRMYVLEANPKPDLKAPTETGVTSLIARGLSHYGMRYDDLILSLLADRVDTLMRLRRGSSNHLTRLLTEQDG